MNVVAYSEEISTHTGRKNGNRAAKSYGVNKSQPKWPDLEESLKKWVIEQREEKRKVSTIQIRLEAKRMAAAMYIMNFRAGSGWCNKFMQRAGLSDIGNMGEVPVTFDMPGKYTVDRKGAQDITITTTGGEKTNFTVVLGVTADGNFCPPMVIFDRKTIPKDTPPGVVVKANCRGWMNEVLMTDWIETCWMARKDPATSPEQSVLILDSA
ncbi:unnamed protein product [Cylicocyclus nassatus]|uniref:HTH CENPB-type domain-containing protein n=1 Tax=Cylicocyclus nassatus TaxID=53992 RepID=A0AA36M9G0_CYLNA|nr:unnamed protein product [Cylicocyclus nassatus]